MRRKERKRFSIRPELKDTPLFFECLDYNAVERKFSSYLADFPARSKGKPFTHEHDGFDSFTCPPGGWY